MYPEQQLSIKGEFKLIELGHAKDTQRCCSIYSLGPFEKILFYFF